MLSKVLRIPLIIYRKEKFSRENKYDKHNVLPARTDYWDIWGLSLFQIFCFIDLHARNKYFNLLIIAGNPSSYN